MPLGNPLETASPSSTCQFHDPILAENRGPPQQECQKQPLTGHPTWKKGTKINNRPKTQNTDSPQTRGKFARKNFTGTFQKCPSNLLWPPPPHYFFSSHRTGPHHRLIRAPATTSRLTVTPGPIQAPDPILTPGNKNTLIPILTLTPRNA